MSRGYFCLFLLGVPITANICQTVTVATVTLQRSRSLPRPRPRSLPLSRSLPLPRSWSEVCLLQANQFGCLRPSRPPGHERSHCLANISDYRDPPFCCQNKRLFVTLPGADDVEVVDVVDVVVCSPASHLRSPLMQISQVSSMVGQLVNK